MAHDEGVALGVRVSEGRPEALARAEGVREPLAHALALPDSETVAQAEAEPV